MMKYMKSVLFLVAVLALSGSVSAQGGKKFIINHFVSDQKVIESHLVITDVDGSGPVVNMSFYDNAGNKLGSGKELIQPFGKLNLNPSRYVKGATVNGSIHIEASGGNIVAEYWQFYKNPNESWKNTTSIGYEAPGYTKLVIDHFVADPGVEAYIVLASSSGSDAVVNITFNDDQGNEIGKARELVPANGKAILKPNDYVTGPATGVAYIRTSGGSVTGEYWQAEAKKKYQLTVPMAGI
jgi:hypothetical protein